MVTSSSAGAGNLCGRDRRDQGRRAPDAAGLNLPDHVAVQAVRGGGGDDPGRRRQAAVGSAGSIGCCRTGLIAGRLPPRSRAALQHRSREPPDHVARSARPSACGAGIASCFDRVVPIAAAMEELKLVRGSRTADSARPRRMDAAVGMLPLIHQPGERWMYSTGADVAGVSTAWARMQPSEASRRNVSSQPLAWRTPASAFPPAKSTALRRATARNLLQSGRRSAYDEAEGGQRQAARRCFHRWRTVSTVDDDLAFAQMLLNRGCMATAGSSRARSVESTTVDHLDCEAILGLQSGDLRQSRLGTCMAPRPRHHFSGAPAAAYGCRLGGSHGSANDPAEDLTTLIFTNRAFE